MDSEKRQTAQPARSTVAIDSSTFALLNGSRDAFDLTWKSYIERLGAWLALQPPEVQRRVLFPLPGTVWIATAGREVDVQAWRSGQITDMGLADIRPPMSSVPRYAQVSPPPQAAEPGGTSPDVAPPDKPASKRSPRGGRR